jgi:hypothetical protein
MQLFIPVAEQHSTARELRRFLGTNRIRNHGIQRRQSREAVVFATLRPRAESPSTPGNLHERWRPEIEWRMPIGP